MEHRSRFRQARGVATLSEQIGGSAEKIWMVPVHPDALNIRSVTHFVTCPVKVFVVLATP
jgi:hypothetical protein